MIVSCEKNGQLHHLTSSFPHIRTPGLTHCFARWTPLHLCLEECYDSRNMTARQHNTVTIGRHTYLSFLSATITNCESDNLLTIWLLTSLWAHIWDWLLVNTKTYTGSYFTCASLIKTSVSVFTLTLLTSLLCCAKNISWDTTIWYMVRLLKAEQTTQSRAFVDRRYMVSHFALKLWNLLKPP